jgi:hypothetical protein
MKVKLIFFDRMPTPQKKLKLLRPWQTGDTNNRIGGEFIFLVLLCGRACSTYGGGEGGV